MVDLNRWSKSNIDAVVAELGTTRTQLAATANEAEIRKLLWTLKLDPNPLPVIEADVERLSPEHAALLRAAAERPERGGMAILGVIAAALGLLYLLFVRK